MTELTAFGAIILETAAAIATLVAGAWLIKPAIDDQSLSGGWPFFVKLLRILPGFIVSASGLCLLGRANSTDEWYLHAHVAAASAATQNQKASDTSATPPKTLASADLSQAQKVAGQTMLATVPLQITLSVNPQMKLEGDKSPDQVVDLAKTQSSHGRIDKKRKRR